MKHTINRLLWCALLFSLISNSAFGKGGAAVVRNLKAQPDEIITLSNSMPFNQALKIFNDLSLRYKSKIIIDPQEINNPIGVDIKQMHWFDAFVFVLEKNELTYEEYPDHIMIVPGEGTSISAKWRSDREMFENREVVISAVFFEANLNKMKQLGSSWNFINQNNETADMTAGENKTGLMEIRALNEFDFGSMTTIFKALASNQLGEILASPQITVRSEKEGRIQVGSDFSVTVQDYAGNAVSQFFSTGAIIKVTPKVITVDSTVFIHIDLDAQRSSASSGELGIEIKTTAAQTSILLLDGEETLIGGLYSSEESFTREGVPLLKDLPWWFFGLRYLFGYEIKNIIRKELIVLMRADLLPTLEERAHTRIAKSSDTKSVDRAIEGLKARIKNLKDIE